MMNAIFLPCLIVIFFSFVQSLFGTGLLVFGTPLFLILGYSFEQTLLHVLPASLLISLMQIEHGRGLLHNFKKEFFFFTLPPLIGFLALTLLGEKTLQVQLPIGGALLLFSLLRISPALGKSLSTFFHHHRKSLLMTMGAIHGATNMGGAFLNIYVNGIHHEKEHVRVHIAYGYAVFMIVQIATLFLLTPEVLHKVNLPLIGMLPILAGAIYIFIGNKVFAKTNDQAYYHLMTILMFVLGAMLLLNAFW